uniref:Uncharacterized protein n=1 Tax=Lepeophtheirus salmonis TaxID=72036 RepID=A0A0K2TS68_LEPSM
MTALSSSSNHQCMFFIYALYKKSKKRSFNQAALPIKNNNIYIFIYNPVDTPD